jgi:signal transduction histidine kinase
MFANITRDRLIILGTSLIGGLLLYGALFWIVHRASRQLQAQRQDLERQTRALTATNDELRATQAQLRATARLAALGEAAASVAHGIRNPLANIRAAAQIALDARADREMCDRYLGTITAEVDRLGTWLRALLDTARPFEPRLVPVALNAVVEDVVSVLRDRLERGGITLERDLAPGLPMVRADVAHLQQALLSVLENAVDVLGDGGTLSVVTTAVPDGARPFVRLTVRDTGEGMTPELLARVFDIFYTTKTRGTGLGLAIARKVVEAHGGRIDLASEPGAGTTVRIDLPAAEATT